MSYEFPEIEMSEAEKTWLNEVYRRYREGGDRDTRVMKVALEGKLPREFNPYAHDRRLYSGTRPTLLGIWHVDPDSDIFGKTDHVIRAIREAIFEDPKVQEVSSLNITIDGVSQDEVQDIFRLISSSSRTHMNVNQSRTEDGRNECKLDVGDV